VSGLQQAPFGGGTGQVVVLHGTLAPSHVNAQPSSVVIVQAPVAVSQQAPVGGGTGQLLTGSQVQSLCQLKPTGQLASVT